MWLVRIRRHDNQDAMIDYSNYFNYLFKIPLAEPLFVYHKASIFEDRWSTQETCNYQNIVKRTRVDVLCLVFIKNFYSISKFNYTTINEKWYDKFLQHRRLPN